MKLKIDGLFMRIFVDLWFKLEHGPLFESATCFSSFSALAQIQMRTNITFSQNAFVIFCRNSFEK